MFWGNVVNYTNNLSTNKILEFQILSVHILLMFFLLVLVQIKFLLTSVSRIFIGNLNVFIIGKIHHHSLFPSVNDSKPH